MDFEKQTEHVSEKTTLPETEGLAWRTPVGSEDSRDIINVAEEYFQSGQIQRAEQILQQLLMQETLEPRVFYLLGTIYYDQGRHHKAEVAFKRCLDLNPEFRDASIALAILYNDLGEYEKAEEIYQRARSTVEQTHKGQDVHIESLYARKHEELGDLYLEHNCFTEAHQEFEKALKHAPQETLLSIKSAKALEKGGARQAAIEKLKELKSAFPEHIPTRLALGMCYFNAHRLPEAVSEWEAALKREPGNREATLYLKVASQSHVTAV